MLSILLAIICLSTASGKYFEPSSVVPHPYERLVGDPEVSALILREDVKSRIVPRKPVKGFWINRGANAKIRKSFMNLVNDLPNHLNTLGNIPGPMYVSYRPGRPMTRNQINNFINERLSKPNKKLLPPSCPHLLCRTIDTAAATDNLTKIYKELEKPSTVIFDAGKAGKQRKYHSYLMPKSKKDDTYKILAKPDTRDANNTLVMSFDLNDLWEHFLNLFQSVFQKERCPRIMLTGLSFVLDTPDSDGKFKARGLAISYKIKGKGTEFQKTMSIPQPPQPAISNPQPAPQPQQSWLQKFMSPLFPQQAPNPQQAPAQAPQNPAPVVVVKKGRAARYSAN